MTVFDLKSEIAHYKRSHCPAIPKKKKDLIRVCEQLGLKTTKADTKVYKKFNMKISTDMEPKMLYTKKEFIKKIVQRNNRDPAFYKAWKLPELKEYYASMD